MTMANPYGWIITEDHLATTPEKSRANVFIATANADLTTFYELSRRLKAGTRSAQRDPATRSARSTRLTS
jgi:hypothetical protein